MAGFYGENQQAADSAGMDRQRVFTAVKIVAVEYLQGIHRQDRKLAPMKRRPRIGKDRAGGEVGCWLFKGKTGKTVVGLRLRQVLLLVCGLGRELFISHRCLSRRRR